MGACGELIAIDHLVVTGPTLQQAVSHVEAALGIDMGPGGEHDSMATHNRLISLGPGIYPEAIAIDPAGRDPGRARWYNLDHCTVPALSHWAIRTDDLSTALAASPEGSGVPVDFTRGRYSWSMAVPVTGQLPFGGASPALLQWSSDHPSEHFEESGCRLGTLRVSHPDVHTLMADFPALTELNVEFTVGAFALTALISTPAGDKVLA